MLFRVLFSCMQKDRFVGLDESIKETEHVSAFWRNGRKMWLFSFIIFFRYNDFMECFKLKRMISAEMREPLVLE